MLLWSIDLSLAALEDTHMEEIIEWSVWLNNTECRCPGM